jgi:hypothetical protein
MENTHIRVVLNNGKHRDFNLQRVFTTSDINSLVTDILIFVKNGERAGYDIHSWYGVKENEKGDSTPA